MFFLYFCGLYSEIVYAIKGLKIIVIVAVVLFCVGYLTPVITLNIPYVQRKLMLFSETELSRLLHTTVKISEIDVNWLNRFTFRDVVIEDLKGDSLLRADNITAGFKLLPVLKNKWILTTVRLFGVSCHINKESLQSEMNIQFLLDAFSGDSQADSNMEMQIESILIRRGKIMYDVLDKENTKQSFNPNHISIDNLSGRLSIRHYSKDSLQAQINRLSFNEISGLNVNRLSAGINGNRDSLSIENLSLTLPYSSIMIPSAAIWFAQEDSLKEMSGQSSLSIRLASSTVAPKDFAFLTPVLKDFTDVVHVTADVSGHTNSLSLEQLTLTYGDDLFFAGNMDLRNAVNKAEELFLFGQVKSFHVTTKGLQRIATNFNPHNMPLPAPVMNLGELNFTGEISGFTDHLVAFGNLSSPVGSVQMDMLIAQQRNRDTTLYLRGSIASSDLDINALFEEGNPYGKARFYVELDMAQPRGKTFSGVINAQINELEYRTHTYENIYVSGKYKENEYEGLVKVNDPNGQLEMQGLFSNRDEKSVFDFMAQLKHFHPDKLHLTDRFENPDISLEINANFSGNKPDDFNGYIELKDFVFLTEKDSFSIPNFRLETEANEQAFNQINISSSILNGGINGDYSFSVLIPNLLATVENYLPSLINTVYTRKEDNANQVSPRSGRLGATNNFIFDFTVENTENLSKTLKLPVAILKQSGIHGHYNSVTHSLSTFINAPALKTGNIKLENVNLHLDNTDETISLKIDAVQSGKNEIHNYLNVTTTIEEDQIFSLMKWSSDMDEKFEAELTTSTIFIEEPDSKSGKKLRTEITIPPAQIILKDSIWNIEPASITISDGKVMVDNFYVTKDNQHLMINGALSNFPSDTLFLDLKDLEISYIFDILNKPQIQFGGHATGKILACDLFGSMMIEGRLEVEDFSFHNAVQGKLNIQSEWDNEQQGILLVGSIYKTDSIYTDVEGHIFPIGPEQGLSLTFNANEINIGFLQRYMSFADSISGLGFGEVRIFGPFSYIYLEGTPYVKDLKLKLNLLNTVYTLSDTVFLEKDQISTRNTTVYDREGHAGNMDFTLRHSGFRDMAYNLEIKTDSVLVYDMPERLNPEIYGKVYASGTATISGTEDYILVEGNVRSDPGTAVGFNFANNSTVDNFDFITFKEQAEMKITDEIIRNEKQDNQKSDMEYMLNFLVNITPDAQFELMMNPATGDKIIGNGSGNFQVQYGSQNDIQIFGNYLISGGLYNFNLEQVIRKRFNIRDGSIVAFRGDPMTAELSINAIYNLAANIQDLDDALIKDTASPTVSVNCVLTLDGHLQNPSITFDLELPNSNLELERQVKSFIDTEDMMTRQIIYLLLLHKFYTPDYSRNDFRGNEFSAVASQALSAQLSNILNSLTDKVQIGTLIRSRQDGIKDTEIDMLLSSQLLNNRLLFNGNFGYKDNYIQSNAFVGEFDLEYKLSRSGDISLKAYNHANDLYRYTKSLTRQGVGVMFRKDFSLFSDLFQRRRKKPNY